MEGITSSFISSSCPTVAVVLSLCPGSSEWPNSRSGHFLVGKGGSIKSGKGRRGGGCGEGQNLECMSAPVLLSAHLNSKGVEIINQACLF